MKTNIVDRGRHKAMLANLCRVFSLNDQLGLYFDHYCYIIIFMASRYYVSNDFFNRLLYNTVRQQTKRPLLQTIPTNL